VKLLFAVEEFAGKPMIRIEWGKEGLFFSGQAPTVPSLITVDMPGLKSERADAVRSWLVEHHKAGKAVRREDTTLTSALWRPTVLDDFLDAHNATSMVWYVATYFSLAHISAFAEAHGPTLHREIRDALTAARAKRPTALRKVGKRTDRIVPVLYASQRRVVVEVEAIEVELDREDVARLRSAPFGVEKWIQACVQLRSDTVKRELLGEIGKRLVETGADIPAALDRMIAKKLDSIWCNDLWTALGPNLHLPPNTTGETVDLTKAREATVAMSWDVWKSKRIGPVKLGRSALVLTSGTRHIYVRGERKLKHQIKRRGGSITRWGNTLTIAAKDPSSVHAALLRVDEIDSLAQLSPARAVALVPESLPAGHPISKALAHAGDDPRWRRILADLLIERLVGIDADVARRLARAEARANRR
jgi:tRNA threonylcarbamoyladenosine modification (KEOPS) complex  Pcc1 subunit